MEKNLETIKKLKALPTDKWFTVITKSGVNLTEIVKELIDNGEYTFELSDNHQQFRRLHDPFTAH